MTANDNFQIHSFDSYDKGCISDITYYPNLEYDFHYDDISKISLVVSGEVQEIMGAHEVYAQPGSIVTKPVAAKHKNKFGPNGTRIVSISLEDSFLEDLFSNGKFKWNWYTEPSQTIAVYHTLYTIKQEDNGKLFPDLITDLAIQLNKDSFPLINHKPVWLNDVIEKIHAEYTLSSFTVRALAKEFNIHPVYLARVFRRFYNCSIKDYINALRLKNVVFALYQGKSTLAEIAYNEGFADQSHLTRVFKSSFGSSPGNFRNFIAVV